MKNIAVINGIGLRAPAFRPVLDGASASARALAFARQLPDVDRSVLFLSRPLAEPRGPGMSMSRGNHGLLPIYGGDGEGERGM